MANWNNPTLASLYTDFLSELKARDEDAITMFASAGSNIPTNSKRWDGATLTFQNWNGSAWASLVLAVAGGGTGSANASGARTNLGLGTMAVQNSSAVTITGGSITGVNLAASTITSGEVALARGGTGASLALGASGAVLQSNGSAVVFGTNGAALTALNASNVSSGNLPIARMPDGGTWTLGTNLAFNFPGGSNVFTVTGAGVVVGSPTGGSGGPGTINAQNIFINGVALATGAGVPTGVIAIFDTSCPSGWTRVSAFDGRVLVGAASYGSTGGASTHSHGVSITSGQPSDSDTQPADVPTQSTEVGSPSGFFINEVDSNGSHAHSMPHTHGVSGNTDAASSFPPYIEVVYCKKD